MRYLDDCQFLTLKLLLVSFLLTLFLQGKLWLLLLFLLTVSLSMIGHVYLSCIVPHPKSKISGGRQTVR